MAKNKFSNKIFWVCFFICLIFFLKQSWDYAYVGYYADDAHYVLLSKALLSGKGYVNLADPNEPQFRGYPPGFPLFLAPFVLIVNGQYDLLKWVNIVIVSVVIFFCCRLFYNKLPPLLMCVFIILFITNIYVIASAVSVMSEPLFMLFLVLFFIMLDQFQGENKNSWCNVFIIGCIIMVCVSVRAVGIILLLPVLILGFKLSDVKLLIGGTLPVTLLLLLAYVYKWPQSYNLYHTGAPFSFDSHIAIQNLIYYLEQVVNSVNPLYPVLYSWNGVLLLAAAISIIIGIIYYCKEHNWIWLVFLISYLLVLSFWPYQEPRLLLPVLPFMYYFLLNGISQLFKLKWKIQPISLCIGIILVFVLWKLMFFFHTVLPYYRSMDDRLKTAFQWLKHNTQITDVIMLENPPTCYLLTERKARRFVGINERYEAMSFIYSANVKYLLFNMRNVPAVSLMQKKYNFEIRDYQIMADENPRHFQKVFQLSKREEGIFIYKVLPKKEEFMKSLELTKKAMRLYNENKYKEAVSLLKEALSLEPNFYLSLNLLGMTLVDKGEIAQGIKIIKKSISLYPSLERGYAALAYACQKKGDIAGTKRILYQALDLANRQKHFRIAQDIQQEIEKLK